MFNNLFFFFENCAVYEVIWNKIWYSNTGHRWQYNSAHALCTLYN